MPAKMLDHIGMVVADIQATAQRIESALGLKVVAEEDYGDGLIAIAFIPVGQGLDGPKIELLEPHRPGSSAWDFLQAHGDGVEHVAFLVDDVDQTLDSIRGMVPLADQYGRPGAGKMTIAFLDGRAIAGLLAELVSPARKEYS